MVICDRKADVDDVDVDIDIDGQVKMEVGLRLQP
jgi:hypothetical protein